MTLELVEKEKVRQLLSGVDCDTRHLHSVRHNL